MGRLAHVHICICICIYTCTRVIYISDSSGSGSKQAVRYVPYYGSDYLLAFIVFSQRVLNRLEFSGYTFPSSFSHSPAPLHYSPPPPSPSPPRSAIRANAAPPTAFNRPAILPPGARPTEGGRVKRRVAVSVSSRAATRPRPSSKPFVRFRTGAQSLSYGTRRP